MAARRGKTSKKKVKILKNKGPHMFMSLKLQLTWIGSNLNLEKNGLPILLKSS